MLPLHASPEKEGKYLGADFSETPLWFKESFLEFEEDVAEATEQGKRVMLYFHQEGCPYCARLVEENFAEPSIESFTRKHFDGITLNMWGDKEVVSVAGQSFTEKTFAEALKVQYTPTLIFLNEQGRVALRLNGYYPPKKFRKALQYAAFKKELEMSFSEFMISDQMQQSGSLIFEDFFQHSTNLKKLLEKEQKPTAIYFEAVDCEECETMHKRILTDPATRKLAQKVTSVQMDVYSGAGITTHTGEKMSQREYAKRLNIGYTPAVVLFDNQGVEVHRMEGFLKTFHFQSSLAYVLEKAYSVQPSFQRYLSARGEKLREQGFDTDIWGYDSSYSSQ